MLRRCDHGMAPRLCVVIGCVHYDGRRTRRDVQRAPERPQMLERIWEVRRENPQLTARDIATRLGCGVEVIRLALKKYDPA